MAEITLPASANTDLPPRGETVMTVRYAKKPGRETSIPDPASYRNSKAITLPKFC